MSFGSFFGSLYLKASEVARQNISNMIASTNKNISNSNIITSETAGKIMEVFEKSKIIASDYNVGSVITHCPEKSIELGGAIDAVNEINDFFDEIKISTGLVKKIPDGSGVDQNSPLALAAKYSNPTNSKINCGYIDGAVINRLRGVDDYAVAIDKDYGTNIDLGNEFSTNFIKNQSFEAAFEAVKKGGDQTIAIINILPPAPKKGQKQGVGHTVVIANNHGTVGIIEGQNWGARFPSGVITNSEDANTRYNPNGEMQIEYGIIPPFPFPAPTVKF
jgi:hypothetical protein